jgi:aminotransferase EvaB
VDVDPDTFLMDVRQVEAAITPKTRCLLPVHLYGQCADISQLMGLARARGLAVVEDAAQAHGADCRGLKAGSLGDLGVFSFYPTKVLGTYGDGGLVVTSDEPLAARLRRLRFYGMEKVYYAEEHGYNSRLDELHAEILLRKLRRLDGYIARRRAVADRYRTFLSGTSLRLPTTAEGNGHVWYLYVVRHPDRDRILEELARREIRLNVSYRWPIHLMRGYRGLGYQEGQFPAAERAAREIFSLPMYPSLSEKDQATVCRALGEVLGEKVNV